MTGLLELPPLGPDEAVRARRKRIALGALGVAAFVGAAIGVPLALAGREDDHPRRGRGEREP